ncbi:MAG: serine hydrolase domain-containing protein [Pseudomonadota bacterium]
MISKFSRIAAFGLLLHSSLSAASCAQDAEPGASLETVAEAAPDWLPARDELDALRASFSVPGAAIVAVDQCQPSAPVNLGLARLSPDEAVSDQTVFEAASLSKPVFAYVVLKLVERGVISLDERIAETFDYPRIEDKENYRKLTPRLILSHQTGLPNWVGDTDDPARTDVVPFEKEPGSDYSYSGEAYELLRAFIEFKAGLSLDALFKRDLGALMPNSGFRAVRSDLLTAKGYRTSQQTDAGRDIEYLGGGAGGLVSTASDYARFVSLVCSGDGLSEELQSLYLSPQIDVNSPDYPGLTSWGLGWGLIPMGADTFVFHDGNNDEFRSFAGFSMANGEGLVILTNGRNGADLISAILEESQ